jgi:DNA-binding GntR family transcriptional regulator
MPKRAPENHDSSVEVVLKFTRQAIVDGRFAPDTKLIPRQIAAECGVSFIPVREALRVLVSEGFVTFFHNRGAWVTPLSIADLEDLYAIRIELETEAVRCASPMSVADIERLTNILNSADRASARGDRKRVLALNRDFHFFIYEKTQSPRRLRLIEQMWQHAERYQRLSLNYRHDAADEEHRDVIAALAKDDSRGAAQAMRTHLETTVNLIRIAFTSTPDAQSLQLSAAGQQRITKT